MTNNSLRRVIPRWCRISWLYLTYPSHSPNISRRLLQRYISPKIHPIRILYVSRPTTRSSRNQDHNSPPSIHRVIHAPKASNSTKPTDPRVSKSGRIGGYRTQIRLSTRTVSQRRWKISLLLLR